MNELLWLVWIGSRDVDILEILANENIQLEAMLSLATTLQVKLAKLKLSLVGY